MAQCYNRRATRGRQGAAQRRPASPPVADAGTRPLLPLRQRRRRQRRCLSRAVLAAAPAASVATDAGGRRWCRVSRAAALLREALCGHSGFGSAAAGTRRNRPRPGQPTRQRPRSREGSHARSPDRSHRRHRRRRARATEHAPPGALTSTAATLAATWAARLAAGPLRRLRRLISDEVTSSPSTSETAAPALSSRRQQQAADRAARDAAAAQAIAQREGEHLAPRRRAAELRRHLAATCPASLQQRREAPRGRDHPLDDRGRLRPSCRGARRRSRCTSGGLAGRRRGTRGSPGGRRRRPFALVAEGPLAARGDPCVRTTEGRPNRRCEAPVGPESVTGSRSQSTHKWADRDPILVTHQGDSGSRRPAERLTEARGRPWAGRDPIQARSSPRRGHIVVAAPAARAQQRCRGQEAAASRPESGLIAARLRPSLCWSAPSAGGRRKEEPPPPGRATRVVRGEAIILRQPRSRGESSYPLASSRRDLRTRLSYFLSTTMRDAGHASRLVCNEEIKSFFENLDRVQRGRPSKVDFSDCLEPQRTISVKARINVRSAALFTRSGRRFSEPVHEDVLPITLWVRAARPLTLEQATNP